MPFPDSPKVLLRPFAAEGAKNDIPDTKTTTGDGYASMKDGFPSETQLPIAAGGIPPRRPDMNGILNIISQLNCYLSFGAVHLPFSNVVAANGGYPLSALIRPDLNTDGRILMSGSEHLTSNPNIDPTVIGTEWYRANGIPDYCPGVNHYAGELVIWPDDLMCYRCKRINGPTYGGVRLPSDSDFWISLPDWIAESLNIKGGIPHWSADDCYSPLPHIVWDDDQMLYVATAPSGPCVAAGAKKPTTSPEYWMSLPDWLKQFFNFDNGLPEPYGDVGSVLTVISNNVLGWRSVSVPKNKRYITSSGTFTAPVTGIYQITAIGAAGGGGGAATHSSSVNNFTMVSGGAAGSSGFKIVSPVELAAGQTVNVVIGSGGSGGVSVANGQAPNGSPGGATSFGNYVTANGGDGGGGGLAKDPDGWHGGLASESGVFRGLRGNDDYFNSIHAYHAYGGFCPGAFSENNSEYSRGGAGGDAITTSTGASASTNGKAGTSGLIIVEW